MARSSRPKGPCDIYAPPATRAWPPTARRALSTPPYNGPLYQAMRQSDGTTSGHWCRSSPPRRQFRMRADTPTRRRRTGSAPARSAGSLPSTTNPAHRNDLTQAPRGGFSGPAMGGFNNVPIADMAPLTIMGHKVYGVFIEPGMGIRNDDPKGTAVDDQAGGHSTG